eukprot:6208777-Pleurochrysis_carterae.AAC.5
MRREQKRDVHIQEDHPWNVWRQDPCPQWLEHIKLNTCLLQLNFLFDGQTHARIDQPDTSASGWSRRHGTSRQKC